MSLLENLVLLFAHSTVTAEIVIIKNVFVGENVQYLLKTL